jgi:hypothetical protein
MSGDLEERMTTSSTCVIERLEKVWPEVRTGVQT